MERERVSSVESMVEEEEQQQLMITKWRNSKQYEEEVEEWIRMIQSGDKEYARMYRAASDDLFNSVYQQIAPQHVVRRVIANTPRKPYWRFLLMVSLKLFGLYLCLLLGSGLIMGVHSLMTRSSQSSVSVSVSPPLPSASRSQVSPPLPSASRSQVVNLATLKNEFDKKFSYLESQFQLKILSLEAELKQIKSKDVAYERSHNYPECKIK